MDDTTLPKTDTSDLAAALRASAEATRNAERAHKKHLVWSLASFAVIVVISDLRKPSIWLALASLVVSATGTALWLWASARARRSGPASDPAAAASRARAMINSSRLSILGSFLLIAFCGVFLVELAWPVLRSISERP